MQGAPLQVDRPGFELGQLDTHLGGGGGIDGLILEYVGQVGGPVHAVAVQGSAVLAGVGASVLALDVSHPARPEVIGQSPPLPAPITDITTAPGLPYAYVTAGSGGFYVLDLTDIADLRLVGSYPTSCETAGVALSASGDRAYVAEACLPDRSGLLEVIAVDEPRTPSLLGSFAMPAEAHDVAVAGTTAYVANADRQGGLRIVDMADPGSPVDLGFADAREKWFAVEVAVFPSDPGISTCDEGGQASQVIALAGGFGGVSVLDVSDPGDVQDLGLFCGEWGPVMDITIAGNIRAYGVNGQGGLCVLDMSNPAAPVEVIQVEIPGPGYAVAVDGATGYIAGTERLSIVDLTGDQATVLGAFGTVVDAADLAVATTGPATGSQTTLAYIADRWFAGGVLVADLTDPRRPRPVSYLRVDGPVQGVAVTEDRAYAAANSPARLVTIDISEPQQPVQTSSLTLPNYALDVSLSPGGDYAYLGNQGYGVRVYSLEDADAPRQIALFEPAQYPEALTASGRYLYVADGLERMAYRLDITVPAAPMVSASWDTRGWTHDITASGGRTYVAAGGYGLQIYPDDIRLVLNNVFSVHLADSFALVVDRIGYEETWLRAVAISEQVGPWVTSNHRTPGQGWKVVVPPRSNYAYVADGRSGVSVFALLRDRWTTTVEPEGGSLISPSGDVALIFPTGAFADTVELAYRRLLTDQESTDLAGIGHLLEVTGAYVATGRVAGVESGQSYSMALRYSDDDSGPVVEETLALYRWDGEQWVLEPSSAVHPVSNTVTASPEHLGLFCVLGEARWHYLPLFLGGGVPPVLPTPIPTPIPPAQPALAAP